MTKQEFESRTLVSVSNEEFNAIHVVYMYSELDKDRFCKMWCKMNASRVTSAKVDRIVADREQANRDFAYRLVNNGYTHDEMDTDAVDYFNEYQQFFLIKRLHIELSGVNSHGILYERTLRDILWDLNKYLYPNA